jgi:hypothetical protein
VGVGDEELFVLLLRPLLKFVDDIMVGGDFNGIKFSRNVELSVDLNIYTFTIKSKNNK